MVLLRSYMYDSGARGVVALGLILLCKAKMYEKAVGVELAVSGESVL